jgi:ribosomal protein S18 acetylase RimI-like enzyme
VIIVVAEPASQTQAFSQGHPQGRNNPYPIVLAEVEHLNPISELLNAHRVAQGKLDNQPAVAHFLFERIINHEALIFLALEDEHAAQPQGMGFLILYPTYFAQTLMPVWILGELYVTPVARRQGVARSLLNEALALVHQRGDQGLTLEVDQDNTAARQLLAAMGFQQQAQLAGYHYTFSNPTL